MRNLALTVALLTTAAIAGGIPVNGTPKNFDDCASGGSAAQTLTSRTYLLRVFDETTWLCFAASGSTCASGGDRYPAGTVILVTLAPDQVSVSCRSTGSTGDATLTPAG